MLKLVGVRFKPERKMYEFDPGDIQLKRGDHVICDTERGLGFGTVVMFQNKYTVTPNREIKKIIRIADENDLKQQQYSLELENAAFQYCLECIKELDLKMNLFLVEGNFDCSKLTFFFTADGRVDFRELVKMMVRNFRTKIEMRQVSVRNQTKMWGGIGRCGREICCASCINRFDPVSIRMAKEQNLSLNPTKISGLCGRLMCCLVYEYETYRELKKSFPLCGKMVQTRNGPARIIRLNVICNRVAVRYESGTELEISLDEIKEMKKNPDDSKTKENP